jgi:hypothetical protein
VNSVSVNGLAVGTPKIRRKRRPAIHKVYAKSQWALNIRARSASALVNAAYAQLPWLRPEHRPLVARWAELQVIIQCAFNGIVQNGMFRTDIKSGELSAKRLVHDYRQLVDTQVRVAAALLMTPAAQAAVAPGSEPADLVSLMARAMATAGPEEPVDQAAAGGETAEVGETESDS